MDPSLRPRRRRRTGRGPLLPNLALIAGLFLRPAHTAPVFSPADAPALTLSHELPAPALHRRITGEHVVLADCRDTANKVSSQMAYYLAEPGPTPEDVAVVVTNPGQAALWINAVTSALFTNTGVTFTATIGPKVAEGEWAGTGDNGYGSFNCWQKYVGGLYRYESTTCSQVYVCNHNAKGEFLFLWFSVYLRSTSSLFFFSLSFFLFISFFFSILTLSHSTRFSLILHLVFPLSSKLASQDPYASR